MAEQLGQAGRFVRCDVTRETDIESAVAFAGTVWGRLDMMFNNAGAGRDPSPIDAMSVEG